MTIRVDTSELDRLAFDLSQAPERVQRKGAAVIKRGAVEILKDLRREFSGHSYARGVPFALEMRRSGRLGWDIGELTDAGPQWGIAHILEYGTANSAPVTDMRASLRRELPAIMHHLGDEAEDAVLGGPP